jgi:hypothetical protein
MNEIKAKILKNLGTGRESALLLTTKCFPNELRELVNEGLVIARFSGVRNYYHLATPVELVRHKHANAR